jgi:hypothetical protein
MHSPEDFMRNMPISFCTALVAAATAAGAWAQTQPATTPADYSEPQATVRSFLLATDEASMRAALVITPESERDVEPLLAAMIATTKLQKAAEQQFGKAATEIFAAPTQAIIDARLKMLTKAPVTISGDTATVSLPRDPQTRSAAATITLIKRDGEWKIDAASMLGVKTASRADNDRHAALARALTDVTDQMIKDIQANKFASATDAYREYANRSRLALPSARATTQAP